MLYKLKKFFIVFSALFLFACSGENTKVVDGTLVLGHEVRSFVESGQTKEYWIIDKSGTLYQEYSKIAPIEMGNYIPVHAKLKVKNLPKMEDGFGADYDGTYEVVEIISLESKEGK